MGALVALAACHVDAPGDNAPMEASAPLAAPTQASGVVPAASAQVGLQMPEGLGGDRSARGDVVLGPAVMPNGVIPNVDATLAAVRAQMRFCYLRGIQSDPTMQGHLVVELAITSAGTVPEANVLSSAGNVSRSVTQCALRRLKSLSFTTDHGIGATVRVPIDFVGPLDGGAAAAPASANADAGPRRGP